MFLALVRCSKFLILILDLRVIPNKLARVWLAICPACEVDFGYRSHAAKSAIFKLRWLARFSRVDT